MLSAMSGSSSMMSIKGFINGGCVLGVGNGEWGVGSGRYHLPLPTPHSPFPTPYFLSRYLAMFDHQSFGHVNDQLADVGDVIADALQMFGDKQQPGGAPRG